MKKIFFVFDEMKNSDSPFDTLSGIFESEEEAKENALCEWQHLTPSEQIQRKITVAYVECDDSLSTNEALEIALTEGYYNILVLI